MTLKIRSSSPKPIQLLSCPNVISMQIWLKSATWFIRYCAHKHLLAQIRQFKSCSDLEKNGQGHQNLISSSSCPNVITIQIWLNLPTSSRDMVHTSSFWLKFGSLSPAVTLKIRSKSPKPNQLFIISQCYIHANLVKIHPPVHEISRIQESVMLTPTGSATKTICPPPLWWGT